MIGYSRLYNEPVLGLILILIFVTLAGCGFNGPGLGETMAVDSSAVPGSVYSGPQNVTVRISMVGDIMVHSDQLAGAFDKNTGEYSFAGIFDEVADYLNSADLAVGNLETTLAGREKKYSGYPRFNSPEQILPALQEAGFDVLTTANNHSMDMGEYGVLQTLEYLDSAGIGHTGTFLTPEARNRALVTDIRGFRIGILAYTYGTNGIPVPEGKDYLVNRLDSGLIRQDITDAREQGADIVIVFPHYGAEYTHEPGEKGKKLFEEIFAAGADIVAGSHPHYIQPMERRDQAAEFRGLFTAYSLGNFVSGQKGRYRDSGVILTLELEKEMKSGDIRFLKAAYVPTWVHKFRENGRFRSRVVVVEKALRDYEAGLDQRLTPEDYRRLQEVWAETTSKLSGPKGPEIDHL